MGINQQSLFPGLDGTCTRIKNKYFNPSEVGKTVTERYEEFLELSKTLLPKDEKVIK